MPFVLEQPNLGKPDLADAIESWLATRPRLTTDEKISAMSYRRSQQIERAELRGLKAAAAAISQWRGRRDDGTRDPRAGTRGPSRAGPIRRLILAAG